MTRALAPLAAAALVLGAGCTNLAPTYQRPAAPVPAVFPTEAAASAPATVTPAADLDWARYFAGDARLQRLIALALGGSRDLRVAALSVEAARAQALVRDADRWPTVNAGVSMSRQPTTSGGIASVYSAGLQVTAYEADVFGRLRGLSDAAASQVLASVEARHAVQIALVAAVATTHVALAADDELLRVTRKTLDSRAETLRLIRLRVENGASSEVDLRQAQSLLESARVVLAQGQRQRALDENALALLIGQPLPADLPPGRAVEAASGLPALPTGLPSEVLLRRPDVRQAEQQLIAATANIGVARAAYFPRITLTGSVGTVSGQLSNLFRAGAWSFVPQLVQPLFDAGRNDANLKAAEVARDIAVAQYERAIQSAFREVADALAGRATLGEQLQAQQRLLDAERERTRLADLRYRNGATSFLELLDAQRSLYAAQQGLVQVQAQAAQNLVALYRVLGGGWQPGVPAR
ncbi:MAG: efflux transporter outer membrane subunit [Rubrivivax sp.]|nr:efflux transporter outer membrane subunit [Rubrivivax sp.]